jgi:uncharacterized membrane protein YdjX (TVP38/TMEM64 family)
MPSSPLYRVRRLLRRPALKLGPFTAFAALALLLVGGVMLAGGLTGGVPDLPWLQRGWWLQQHAAGTLWQAQSPLLFLLGYAALFTLLSALALPGCAPLALLAGTWFGGLGGTLVVGLASTLGALLSFLAARHWARDAVQQRLQQRFGHRLQAFEEQLRRHGTLWLFWLRLVPLVPYPVLNPLLGLSRLPMPAFLWPSLAGLTLGSLPWVWAGLGLQTALRTGESPWPALAGAALLLLASAALARHGWARRSASGAAERLR